jgi:hypothetical protein
MGMDVELSCSAFAMNYVILILFSFHAGGGKGSLGESQVEE